MQNIMYILTKAITRIIRIDDLVAGRSTELNFFGIFSVHSCDILLSLLSHVDAGDASVEATKSETVLAELL